ncbi:LacI family transcriptional regulator [Veronia nyctiphanis]|uniref:Autoinducer 2-binding periplasmic protein LuxP n=1 Tax=Veronia nyctiphanis TaxID=1278244 RepID=A0A4Q0YTN1_9GAMM|nr:LacI family DNA-binding transcriptional regulator [Veronia nyctiphanis]RXJ74642.1 LacI family transcriptional regulator [Veronia nyctiphanis]
MNGYNSKTIFKKVFIIKRFSAKQIAAQAGVGLATVDRVLNNRGNVHAQTVDKVHKAIEELEGQYQVNQIKGRTFYFDLLMDTPARFSEQVKSAILAVIPEMASYKIRFRFRFFENISTEEMAKEILNTDRKQCQGLIIKASNLPEIRECIDKLSKKMPVVTVVTDLPESKRVAYIGLDNYSAGQTAAFLLGNWLPTSQAQVLSVTSSEAFHGEEQRQAGFLDGIAAYPHLSVIRISGGQGLANSTEKHVISACSYYKDQIRGVYSIGGGNRAILNGLRYIGVKSPIFIGHDLDAENTFLLKKRYIDAVIDHKLADDARAAIQFLLNSYRKTPLISAYQSSINVITPFSLPPRATAAKR